jgi:hypothetical protein
MVMNLHIPRKVENFFVTLRDFKFSRRYSMFKKKKKIHLHINIENTGNLYKVLKNFIVANVFNKGWDHEHNATKKHNLFASSILNEG